MPIARIRGLQLLGLLFVAACSGPVAAPAATVPASAAPTAPAATAPASPAATVPASAAASGAPPAVAPTDTPAATASPAPAGVVLDQPWALAQLTDVSTGEVFRIADLAASGKVVFVETMAIWCTNCRAQQVAAVTAYEELGPANVEWVVIDVETAETAGALVRYRDQNGFPFRYSISDSLLNRSLADQFGDVVLSPPPVNVIIIGTDGRITHLLGHHSAADLVALAIDHGA